MIKKVGTPQKISKIIKNTGFGIDPNLIVKKLKDNWTESSISLNQLHELVKSLGVVDYTSDDMSHVVELLQSSGITVTE